MVVTAGRSNPMLLKGTVILFTKKERFRTSKEEICLTNQSARLSLQLVSSTVGDPNDRNRGVVGEATYLDDLKSKPDVMFKWKEGNGIPGAVIVTYERTSEDEFFLDSVTVENFPETGKIYFYCKSWIYPQDKYKYKRIFFINIPYLHGETPAPLKPYRKDELLNLRGEDITQQLKEWDRC